MLVLKLLPRPQTLPQTLLQTLYDGYVIYSPVTLTPNQTINE